ncbi:MAG TPA: DUF4233 domain-containing protein [Jatrophihabitans sp.]|nr:DUF4233 domain-containing protein [Jatrophihabitans sp.]
MDGAEQDPRREPEAIASDAGEPEAGEPEVGQLEVEERRQRADRATRGVLAALLCLEAFVVLLVPRAIAQTSEGLSLTKTLLLLALAVLLVGCGFVLRRPWGIGLGSVLQLGLAATVVLIPALAVVVVIFLLLWLYLLRTRRQLLHTPSGWRMLVS